MALYHIHIKRHIAADGTFHTTRRRHKHTLTTAAEPVEAEAAVVRTKTVENFIVSGKIVVVEDVRKNGSVAIDCYKIVSSKRGKKSEMK